MRPCIEAKWLPSGFAGALVHPINHPILRPRTLSESLPKGSIASLHVLRRIRRQWLFLKRLHFQAVFLSSCTHADSRSRLEGGENPEDVLVRCRVYTQVSHVLLRATDRPFTLCTSLSRFFLQVRLNAVSTVEDTSRQSIPAKGGKPRNTWQGTIHDGFLISALLQSHLDLARHVVAVYML